MFNILIYTFVVYSKNYKRKTLTVCLNLLYNEYILYKINFNIPYNLSEYYQIII